MSNFRGEILKHGDTGYENARKVWNGMIDRHPALIVRCMGAADVVDAVRFAREHNLLVSIKGGGHHASGRAVCDGGLMIDLSMMRSIHINVHDRSARAEAGALLGDLDRESQAFGLAVPAGTVSETGIAGLTLGGGFGWLSRQHGLTCDNLISADVITADGEFVVANATENADLFWGLKGGGGNFGIVTSFNYQAHPVGPMVLAGSIFHSLDQARSLHDFFREFVVNLPEEVGTISSFVSIPASPDFPARLHGKKAASISVCYAGDIEEGRRILGPLSEYGSPLLDTIKPTPF
ncbi:MAG: FAD-dependent oxidoreductase, partial [Anaerolineales bacterium]|nr:FAD-dependent oxidoreductase [Anaerolineales bacterium]